MAACAAMSSFSTVSCQAATGKLRSTTTSAPRAAVRCNSTCPTRRSILNKLMVGAPAAGMLLLGSTAYAKDINEAKREKEERKEALREAAQVAKDVGTAVAPDGMQSDRTVPEGQIKSVRT